jgi:hypothetical protein
MAGNFQPFLSTQRSEIWGGSNFQFTLGKSAALQESIRAWYPFGLDFSCQEVNLVVESEPNTPIVAPNKSTTPYNLQDS